jgi:hypothetical protein
MNEVAEALRAPTGPRKKRGRGTVERVRPATPKPPPRRRRAAPHGVRSTEPGIRRRWAARGELDLGVDAVRHRSRKAAVLAGIPDPVLVTERTR